jgi:2-oxoglutarate ferredoxin oxidoreductase subunit delta
MIPACPSETEPMIVIDEACCKGCGICIGLCPKSILESSNQLNSRGYHVPSIVDGNGCTNCRQCELLCPDLAIFIIEEPESANA